MPIKGHVTPLETAKVREAIAYIDKHYTKDISLDNLVEEVRLDRKVFRQIFSDITGKTVHKYLIDVRLAHAKDDLADFTLTIDQVAHRNGFGSGDHFTKVFRKLIGTVPTNFRLELIHKNACVAQ